MRVFKPPIAFLLTVASCLMAPPAGSIAPDEPTDDGWSAEALGAAREQLTDLLANESIDRLDFRARTFEEAIGLITTTAGMALEHARDELTTPDEAVRYIQSVTLAFNTHQPRGLGLTLPKIADLPISDAETAGRLGELLGISASMVRQYVGPGATPEQITDVGTHLFRHIYLDPGWGLTYLDQYYVGVAWIAGLPPSERRPYLEK